MRVNQPLLSGQCIIVADDNRDFQVLIKVVLESHGAHVLEALDGLQAIALVEMRMADAILMDIHMPVMDGYEAARIIRGQGFAIPIVALSAGPCYGKGADPTLGFDACLEKPLDFDQLFATIRRLTDFAP